MPAEQTFNNIERLIPSGRLAVLYHATPTTDIRASAYENFRVPTLNEQYRVFRVRNDVTVANESLRPRAALRWGAGRAAALGAVRGRVTGYWNDVHDLIANVTLSRACPTARSERRAGSVRTSTSRASAASRPSSSSARTATGASS